MISLIELVGAIFAICAALLFAIGAFFIRRASTTSRPIEGVMVTLWVSVSIFLPISLLFYPNSFDISTKAILAFVGSGVLADFLGRISYFTSIKKIGASRTDPFAKGDVLIASIIAVLVLGETINLGHSIGIMVLIFGVIMVSREIQKGGNPGSDFTSLGRTLLLPLSVVVCRGLAGPLDKFGLNHNVPIITGLALRTLAPAFLMTVYFTYRHGSPLKPFLIEERYKYFGAGLSIAAALLLVYKALSLTKVIIAIPLLSLSPLFILVISHFYLKQLEEITRPLTFGTVLVIVGAIILGVFM